MHRSFYAGILFAVLAATPAAAHLTGQPSHDGGHAALTSILAIAAVLAVLGGIGWARRRK